MEGTAPTISPECEYDQGCEPATSVLQGILVVLDTEDWLIDLDMEPLISSLHYGPLTCQLRLGYSHPRFHQRPSSLWLHLVPSSHQLYLGQSSLYLCHRLTSLPLRSVSPPLRLQWVPPSLRFHLCFSHTGSASVLGTLAPPQMLVTTTPVPAVSLKSIDSLSAAWDPLAPSPPVITLMSSAPSTPWLLPDSTPPWVVVTAILWVHISGHLPLSSLIGRAFREGL
ncbi:hypothetical protein DPX16_23443 [Anabarilius grahami]|uniref:Uncharacterized protein n=1 Tax=Anabarilius grahami TaxID=495550 RepID=A0A3N0YRH0_ANAGA|nr:hypothetical protein DPX16_23443 [Anabarilius grahami]